MDTAGKAVLFSGVTVLISLTAVMLVPSPASARWRSDHGRVVFVLAAALTLLPAVFSWLDRASTALAALGAQRRAPLTSLRCLGGAPRRHPLAFGGAASPILLILAAPIVGLRTGMPSIKVVPTSDTSRVGYTRSRGLRPGRSRRAAGGRAGGRARRRGARPHG